MTPYTQICNGWHITLTSLSWVSWDLVRMQMSYHKFPKLNSHSDPVRVTWGLEKMIRKEPTSMSYMTDPIQPNWTIWKMLLCQLIPDQLIIIIFRFVSFFDLYHFSIRIIFRFVSFLGEGKSYNVIWGPIIYLLSQFPFWCRQCHHQFFYRPFHSTWESNIFVDLMSNPKEWPIQGKGWNGAKKGMIQEENRMGEIGNNK